MTPKFIEFIEKHGTPVTSEDDVLSSEQTETIKNTLEELIMIEENNCPMPGQKVDPVQIAKTPDYTQYKEAATSEMLKALADKKMKAQKEAEAKRPMAERIKDYFIKASLSVSKTHYLEQNGYSMSAQQVRTLRRKLERNYGKPGYRPTPKQEQEIIDYLNMPSQNVSENQNNPYKATDHSVSQNVSSLMSMI